MAHAGTPTDLAKQPATSTTNGLWQVLLAGIVILALAVGMVLVAANVAAPKSVAAPAADHRLDQVERQFAATGLVADDGSYTLVETNRGGALTGGSQGSTPATDPGRTPGHFGGQ